MLNNLAAFYGVGAAATSYESIATVTVGAGGASSVSFSSIPSTYKHLQIRAIGRNTGTGTEAMAQMKFNSDSGSNYATHYLYGTGSGTGAGAAASNGNMFTVDMNGSTSTANAFGAGVIDILDYTNTNKYKTVRTLSGWDANGSGFVFLSSGLWMNTNAVTDISLTSGGLLFAQYSQFALYGVKG